MNFDNILQEAGSAAGKAAQKWYCDAVERGPAFSVHNKSFGEEIGPAIGHLLDVCGFAWIEFKDKRTKFYKHCLEVENRDRKARGWREEKSIRRVPIFGEYKRWMGHQELGLKEAAMYAANEVFLKYGIKTRVRSQID